MANTWGLSALWVGLALIATLLAIWFRMSTALSEIVVGTVAQLVIGAAFGRGGLLGSTEWITFLAGTGAIVLTFLAGAELDPAIFRSKWRESLVIGLAGFFGPFLGCTLMAHFLLHWTIMASWLCGVALSTFFLLFVLGGLALWAGSEAVLPAYLIGMVLAGTVGKDHSRPSPEDPDFWISYAVLFHPCRFVCLRAGTRCRPNCAPCSLFRQDVDQDRRRIPCGALSQI